MVNRKIALWKLAVIVLLLAAAGFCVWYFFIRETEEVRIRRTFDRLAAAIEKTGEEGTFVPIGKAREIMKTMADQIAIDIEYEHISGTYKNDNEIIPQIVLARRMVSYLSVSFYDFEFDIYPDDTADVHFTVSARGRAGNEPISEVRDLTAFMRKGEDGEWRFEKISVQKVISGL